MVGLKFKRLMSGAGDAAQGPGMGSTLSNTTITNLIRRMGSLRPVGYREQEEYEGRGSKYLADTCLWLLPAPWHQNTRQ